VHVTAGVGALSRLPELIPSQGKILLLTTAGFTKRRMTERVLQVCNRSRFVVFDQVAPNPELDALDQITDYFRKKDISVIVAIGGGSVLDSGKVLGVTLPSKLETPLQKKIRKGIDHPWESSLPVITIPTTAGTGAEVTPFATVWDKLTQKKYSVSGEMVFPAHALLDPELTITLPSKETFYTGLDAISHALESIWNKNRTPVSLSFALDALNLANEALPIVLKQPDNILMREKMQNASFFAGLAISQTKTALAHSISYPLTIHHGIPHGLACSFTLPALIEKYLAIVNNRTIKQALQKTLVTLKRFDLGAEVAKYSNIAGLFKYIDEMYNPERAGNYVLKIENDDIGKLLSF